MQLSEKFILDSAISSSKLADDSVTTIKIAADAVNAAKIRIPYQQYLRFNSQSGTATNVMRFSFGSLHFASATTFDALASFPSILPKSTVTPTDPDELTRMGYVDSVSKGPAEYLTLNDTVPATADTGAFRLYGYSRSTDPGFVEPVITSASGHQTNLLSDVDVRFANGNVLSTLPKGTVVYVSDGGGGELLVDPAIASNATQVSKLVGIVTDDMVGSGVAGYVRKIGRLTGLDMSTFAERDVLYLSATVAGAVTNVAPAAPNALVRIGIVDSNDSITGSIQLDIQELGRGGSSVSESSGVNYFGLDATGTLASSDDRNAEATIGNWAAFNNTVAGPNPDAGLTGGTPSGNVTLTRTTTTGEILNKTASFLVTKSANNVQGEGFSVLMNVPLGYRTLNQELLSVFKVISGSVVDGDVKFVAWDVTNNVAIDVVGGSIVGAQGRIQARFNLKDSTTAQIRIGVFFASTSAAALTFSFDDLIARPRTSILGMSGLTSQKYDPIFTGLGTVSQIETYFAIHGNILKVSGRVLVGTPTATNVTITPPPNLAFSYAQGGLPAGNTKIIGGFICYSIGASALPNAGYGPFLLFADGSSSVANASFSTSGNNLDYAPGNSTIGPNQYLDFWYEVPLAGRSADIVLQETNSFDLSTYLQNGTRVTGGPPTKLGEYNSFIRAAANTNYLEANGDPAIPPSIANGIVLYASSSGGFAAGDLNNQPSLYRFFVGKNKVCKLLHWENPGRTGIIYTDVRMNAVGPNLYGVDHHYDPVTGILTVQVPVFGSMVGQYTGINDAIGSVAASYFTVMVSENAIGVGIDDNIPYTRVSLNVGPADGSRYYVAVGDTSKLRSDTTVSGSKDGGNTAQITSYTSTPATSAAFRGYKARGTTVAPTAVAADDKLAKFYGHGYTSAGAFNDAAGSGSGMSVLASEAFTSTATGTYLTWETVSNATNVSAERMRLTSGGNLLVGTTTDGGQLLQVAGAAAIARVNLSGTAGNGYVEYTSQSSAPSTPASGFRLYADASNRLAWKGTNGFVRVFDGTSNTADRTYALPDASGTVALASMNARFVEKTVALSDAATIATDAALGNIFKVTLGGNRTLGNPTNPVDGQKIIYQLKQDGSGNRTITLDTSFEFGTDITSISLSTAINAMDILGCMYDGTTSKWKVIAFAKGYT